jgi:hypothetical protein
MANDLATLNGLLDIALRDTSDETWTAAEKNQLIEQAVDDCPHRPLLHDDASIDFVSGAYYHDLPAGVISISRIDIEDTDGNPAGQIGGGLWEVIGDLMTGDAEIFISPRIVDAYDGGTGHLIGYGRYDTTTNLIPDEYVAYVLAHATAAAYQRMASDRARFKQWANDEQTLNISVNELVQLVNDAQLERDRERARIRRWKKPVPAMRSA